MSLLSSQALHWGMDVERNACAGTLAKYVFLGRHRSLFRHNILQGRDADATKENSAPWITPRLTKLCAMAFETHWSWPATLVDESETSPASTALSVSTPSASSSTTSSPSLAATPVAISPAVDVETLLQQPDGPSSQSFVNAGAVQRALITGQHLQQPWHQFMVTHASKAPDATILMLLQVAGAAKALLVFERNQSVLRAINKAFSDDLALVEPQRVLLMDGRLTKVSASDARVMQPYYFFLFNDILVYAEYASNQFKPHRVIHLSLCRLVDMMDQRGLTHAFRILNPQKSITVLAPGADAKRQWLRVLTQAIEIKVDKRLRYLQAIADGSQFERIRRVSMFVAPAHSVTSPTAAGNADVVAVVAAEEHVKCKLCLRLFSLFRRRHACSLCLDAICSDCSTHKYELPSNPNRLATGPQRVCDSCFGVLTNGVGGSAGAAGSSSDQHIAVIVTEGAASSGSITFDNFSTHGKK
jgi:hypothetical protein